MPSVSWPTFTTIFTVTMVSILDIYLNSIAAKPFSTQCRESFAWRPRLKNSAAEKPQFRGR